MTATNETRVTLQRAFVLHQKPYGDTSALVELFSVDYGRIAVIAKGARQMRSPLRAILQPFQRLRVSWTGKGDVKTLTLAESDQTPFFLTGDRLLSALYANELLMKFLPRFDAHESLFSQYDQFLNALSVDPVIERPIRRLEKKILIDSGYELLLNYEGDHITPVDPQSTYRYIFEYGPVAASDPRAHGELYSGQSLLALHGDELEEPAVLADAKRLLRNALQFSLGGAPLHTRQLIRALHKVRENE